MIRISSITFVLFIFSYSLFAQDVSKFLIDKTKFREGIKNVLFNKLIPGNILLIPTTKESIQIEINYKKLSNDTISLRGRIKDIELSNFFLDIEGSEISGAILLNNIEAMKIYSDSSEFIIIEAEKTDNIICTPLPKVGVSNNQRISAEGEQLTASSSSYVLESLPGCPFVVLLDFDGFLIPQGTRWNNGNSIDAKPSNYSDASILESWEIVAEDYRPFNLNITTNETIFNNAAPGKRIRAVITPTSTAAPNSGGVAFMNSFTLRTKEEPCFIYNLVTAKVCGETVSHEVGHTLGLKHDGKDTSEYYSGHNGWGAIMGAVYGDQMLGQFSKGEYQKATNTEDDLTIISTKNGFTFKKDDFGNLPEAASEIKLSDIGVILPENSGIIEKNMDVDYFKFTTTGGKIDIVASPAKRNGDLDILIKLLNVNKETILTNDASGLSATLSSIIPPGQYYISIDGTGKGNPFTDGYSDYGSIGTYSLSGNIPLNAVASVITAIDINSDPNLAIAFPNPFEKELFILQKGEFAFRVYGSNGNLINTGKGVDRATIGKEYNPGFYILNIETELGSKMIRINKF